jgi:hypothetical protein
MLEAERDREANPYRESRRQEDGDGHSGLAALRR